MQWVIVFYRQYGKWSVTVPFASHSDARKHVAMYLDRPDKDYVKDITYMAVDLPE